MPTSDRPTTDAPSDPERSDRERSDQDRAVRERAAPPVVLPEPLPSVRDAAGRPPDLDVGLEFITVTDGPMFDAAETFLYEIYRVSGFCRDSPRRVVEELQQWRDSSVFHIVVDEQQRIIGSVRTILDVQAQLPIDDFDLIDLAELGMAGTLCELSSLAVRASARSSGVVEHIYRAGWLAAFRAGASALVGLVDPWLLDMFVQYYGLPFSEIGTARFHMGGTVTPVAMPLRGTAFANLARTRPEFWAWTLEACTDDEINRWELPAPG